MDGSSNVLTKDTFKDDVLNIVKQGIDDSDHRVRITTVRSLEILRRRFGDLKFLISAEDQIQYALAVTTDDNLNVRLEGLIYLWFNFLFYQNWFNRCLSNMYPSKQVQITGSYGESQLVKYAFKKISSASIDLSPLMREKVFLLLTS